MGLSVSSCDATYDAVHDAVSDAVQTSSRAVKQRRFEQKASEHLSGVCSGILAALSEAAAGRAGGDLERATWHLQMACNYLKLTSGEAGVTEADTVDHVRERLTDRLFLLQAALCSVGQGGAGTRAQGLLEGLELIVAASSLLPPDSVRLHDKGSNEHLTGS